MKKNEFIAECAEKSGLTKKDTKEVLDIFFKVIVEHMKDEDGVSPYAGVKFYTVYRDGREGRLPGSDEKINIPGRYLPKAKFGKSVKEVVN